MVSPKVNGRAAPKKATRAKKTTAGWLRASRAPAFRGGGSLVPVAHHIDGGGGVVVPQPGAFGADGHYRGRKTGSHKYDPVTLRDFGGSAFAGSNVLRFTLSLADREKTTRPYEENFAVRSALRAKANAMVSMPFQLWDGPPSEDGSAPLDAHPVLDLLHRPNRLHSGRELTRAHTINYHHDGEVFWFLMNANGEPVRVNEATGLVNEMPWQILAVRGENVQHKVDKTGMPVEYRYGLGKGSGSSTGGGYSSSFPWQAVIPFIEFDPYNMVRGLGDVRALMREIDLMFQAYRYLDASVKNGGDPGGFITFDESVGQDELDARQAVIDDTYTAENAGRYKVLDRKAKFTPNPTTPKDMEYMSLFEWNLKAICAGVGVPPPIIGWYDDATYNNLDGARRELWTGGNGVLSHAAGQQDVMREKLLKRLSGVAQIGDVGADVYPFFNPSRVEVLKKDRSDQILAASKVAASGVGVSFNEAASQLELDIEPAPHGDVAYVSNTLRETGVPSYPAIALERVKVLAKSGKGGGGANAARAHPGYAALAGEPWIDDHGDRRVWVEMPVRRTAEDADPTIKKRAVAWLGKYEKAIVARLRVFANGGRKPSARAASRARATELRVNSKGLTLKDLSAMVLNEKEWAASLGKLMNVPISAVWKSGLQAARETVGGPLTGITDPRVVEAISKQVLQLSEGVTSSTSTRVRRALLRVLTGVEQTGTLRELIKQALPALTEELRLVFGTKDARALAIAITETNRATESANYLQMGDADVSEKRWKIVGDGNERESHPQQAAVGAIDIAAKFPNGGLHPLDPNLPAKEVVGCRCKLEAAAFADDLAA